jgi:hypothetical protein
LEFNNLEFNNLEFNNLEFNNLEFNNLDIDNLVFDNLDIDHLVFDNLDIDHLVFDNLDINHLEFDITSQVVSSGRPNLLACKRRFFRRVKDGPHFFLHSKRRLSLKIILEIGQIGQQPRQRQPG